MELSVYIAAPFNSRDRAKILRDVLKVHGVGCTATWLDSHIHDNVADDQQAEEAARDLRDIRKADAFILVCNSGPSSTGGMFIEFGYALGLNIPIYVVKPDADLPIRGVFYRLPQVTIAECMSCVVEEVLDEFFGGAGDNRDGSEDGRQEGDEARPTGSAGA
jgi:nucleoside 2-deoxyribosyltransferase